MECLESGDSKEAKQTTSNTGRRSWFMHAKYAMYYIERRR